jgi:hypothetical protein
MERSYKKDIDRKLNNIIKDVIKIKEVDFKVFNISYKAYGEPVDIICTDKNLDDLIFKLKKCHWIKDIKVTDYIENE